MNIKMKCLAIIATLGFFAGIAQGDKPKTYQFSLNTASKVGAEELQPGEYKLAIHSHDAKVGLTRVNTGDEFELDAKVEVGGEKFDSTEIHSDSASGVHRIIEIRLGGSRTRVVFE